jgi:hypothetical protein
MLSIRQLTNSLVYGIVVDDAAASTGPNRPTSSPLSRKRPGIYDPRPFTLSHKQSPPLALSAIRGQEV